MEEEGAGAGAAAPCASDSCGSVRTEDLISRRSGRLARGRYLDDLQSSGNSCASVGIWFAERNYIIRTDCFVVREDISGSNQINLNPDELLCALVVLIWNSSRFQQVDISLHFTVAVT
jgi:hypothetical protein